jgi:hypothetical protein
MRALSWFLPIGIYWMCIAIVRPWGDFPINDDWQYAYLTRYFAEFGEYRAFLPVTTSLVLQAALGSPIIQQFGFSYVALRIGTILLTTVWLLVLQAIFFLLGANRPVRILLALTVVVNPLIFYLSVTFMSEIPAFFLVSIGWLFWLLHLKLLSSHGQKAQRWLIFSLATLGALCLGGAFWIRQLTALFFPALIGARIFTGYRKEGWKSLPPLALQYTPSILAFAIPVIGYFVWSRTTGNFTSSFGNGLTTMLLPNPAVGILGAPVFFLYATAFALPILMIVSRKNPVKLVSNRWMQAWFGFVVLVVIGIAVFGDKSQGPAVILHSIFPYFGNVLFHYGIGPITLTDVYPHRLPIKPTSAAWPWYLFQIGLLLSSTLWIVIGRRAKAIVSDSPGPKSETVVFGVILFGLNYLVLSTAFNKDIFDRYLLGFLPPILALLACTIEPKDSAEPRRLLRSIPVLLIFGFYSVCGVHDLFRWNEVRWEIYKQARNTGIAADSIDGGYEINGAEFFAALWPNIDGKNVYRYPWFFPERRYEIALNPRPGSKVLIEKSVHTWLCNFPPMLFVDKKPLP